MGIKSLLVRYLKNQLTKQELKEVVLTNNIRTQFNDYIYTLLKCPKRKVIHKTKSLSTNSLLDASFLSEIKETGNYSVNWKVRKEELIGRLKMDPKLNVFFILKRNEQVNTRLRRVCLEYGLETSRDVRKIANEGFVLFVRQKEDFRRVFPVLNCVKEISSYINQKCL